MEGIPEIILKPCRNCGSQIERRKYPCGSWEGPRAYARRIYCTAHCAQQGSRKLAADRPHSAMRKRTPEQAVEHGGPYIPRPTKVALRFLEREIPITEWETSRLKRPLR